MPPILQSNLMIFKKAMLVLRWVLYFKSNLLMRKGFNAQRGQSEQRIQEDKKLK